MDRSPLPSRAVPSAGYDPASRALEIEFASGRVYRFEDVPQSVYEWLLRAPSKGGYVARMVNGRYAYRDVTQSTPADTRDLAQALRESLHSADDADEDGEKSRP